MVGEILLYFGRNFDRLVEQFEELLKAETPKEKWWRRALKLTWATAQVLLAGYVVVALSAGAAAAVGWVLDASIPEITRPLNRDPLWEQIHHPVHIIVLASPFFAPLFVMLVKIAKYYEAKIERGKETLLAISDLRKEISEVDARFPEILRDSVSGMADVHPLKDIFAALSPTNRDLERIIGNASDDTARRMHLFSNILLLPPRARRSLTEITELARQHDDADHQHWKALYISFAITLQMDPWKRAFGNERFVFVRDKEEISCFCESDMVDSEFENRLEQDLVEMLHLVNGKLYSVMYRDVNAWQQGAYCQHNFDLLERKGGRGHKTDLRRLFVIDPAWLKKPSDSTPNDYLVSVIIGAMWHKDNSYSARFITLSGVDRRLVRSDETFLSSCLLNETVINMSATSERDGDGPPKYNRYVYRCDSNELRVADYERLFGETWRREEALSIEKFLEGIEVSHPSAFIKAANAYRLISKFGAAPGDGE